LTTLKYSKQRESIKSYLGSTREHPTADTVYMHVRQEYPNISLGTVYRNLNLLADLGEAVKITTPNGGDRFDGCTEPHYHFCCTDCGRVMDLELGSLDHVNAEASKNFDGIITNHSMLFYGTCGECLKGKEK
jgi:Fur family peroxide stress response transcriptional regulator